MKPLVVITGGAGNLGCACAQAFTEHRLLLADRAVEPLQCASKLLCALGFETRTVAADISSPEGAETIVRAAREWGGFSILIHTAGVAPPAPPPVIYAVNLFGTINVLAAFESLTGAGAVGVCLASIAGHRAIARQFDSLLAEPACNPEQLSAHIEGLAPSVPASRLAYAVSKRGTILQVRRRAMHWARRGARLLSVSPGIIADTAMGSHRGSQIPFEGDEIPQGRLGLSSEIAAVVRFAASSEASLMTGTDLLVDGGYLAAVDHEGSEARREQWHNVMI
jgi:NAD(P)-dependent dehydrogenase (short-subunit alcohol dehydrogenase family)